METFKEISKIVVDNSVKKLSLFKVIGKRMETQLYTVCELVFGSNSNQINGDSHRNLVNYCSLMVTCDALIDYSWERMNIGHWKSIKTEWRYLYAYSSLFKVIILVELDQNQTESTLIECLKICDLALIMSPPFVDNVIAKLASKLHYKLNQVSPPRILTIQEHPSKRFKSNHNQKNHCKHIEKLKCLDLIKFQTKYLDMGRPVVITDAINDWPAFDYNSPRKWTLEYILTTAGYRTVPIEIGSKYTDSSWSQKLMTISEFVKNYIETNENGVAYLAQHEIFDQITELKDDLLVPDYCHLTKSTDYDQESDESPLNINFWFGPRGTVSPLHTDPRDNLLIQLLGSKKITLFDANTPNDVICTHEEPLLSNTSKVDLENPDPLKFDKFLQVGHKYRTELTLNEGEILFIPKLTWHHVRSLETSISVSFWFGD